ncbi:Ff.00g079750.m01.CDS01 [Fusarium sp. VM40]|nr:Ff.00g079750.m01.CDS01 [Fusarium sp. VM40]
MDGPNQHYGNQAQDFPDNYNLTGANDTDIDPLLNMSSTGGPVPSIVSNAMDTQFLVSSAMWNPALNNPINFYPSSISSLAPKALTNSPRPPTETRSSPRTPSSEPVFGSTRTSSKSSIPSVDSQDPDAKPRRSSRGAKTQRQPATVEPVAKPPRRRRVSKEPSLKEEDEEEDDDDPGPEGSDKRNRFLKRNRIAASKCRQKKKEWVSNLEDTRYNLEHENNTLHKQYNGLVDELSTIKNQLMEHASCNDANINQWLDNEAKRFVQRIAAQNTIQAPGQPYRNTGDFCDNLRRSSSVATSVPQSIESEMNYNHISGSTIKPRPRG